MRFVREHADPIEADLQHHYGLDLWAEMAAGRMSLRRLRTLIEHLPSTSELAVAIHGPAAEWTLTDDLLGGVLHALLGANWQRGGGKGARPKPIQRPRSKARERVLLNRLRDVARRAEEAKKRRKKAPRPQRG